METESHDVTIVLVGVLEFFPTYPQDSLTGLESGGETLNQKDSFSPPTFSRPLQFRKWMGAPARVLSNTPTFTRGHAEGPSLMRVQLPPYLSELSPNSAPILGGRK